MESMSSRIAELRQQIARNTGTLHSSMDILRMGLNNIQDEPQVLTAECVALAKQNPERFAAFLASRDGCELQSLLAEAFKQFLCIDTVPNTAPDQNY